MLTAETHIQTERPSRYLVQLCKHADSINHKILHLHASKAQARPEVQHVEWSDTDGTLTFSWGRCTMQAGPDNGGHCSPKPGASPVADAFTGFPPTGIAFLAGLAADNAKTYFNANRDTYTNDLAVPLRALVVAVGERLRDTAVPDVCFEPSTGKSLFRINRDTRFS